MWGGGKLGSSGGWLLRVLGPGGRNTKAARPLISSAVYVKNQLSWILQIKPGVFNEYRTMWFKSYRTTFSCLNRVKSFRYRWARLYSTSQTTVDSGEVKTFLALAHKWWDEQGIYAPLHSMNDLRVPFIRRDNLLKTIPNHQPGKALFGMKILDVGCGGGLLTEPLGRLGASVIGIDPVDENIKTAQCHKSFDPVLDKRIEYRVCSLEEIVEETAETFDAVVASEVVEHVIDLETFLQCCCQVLKPGQQSIVAHTCNPSTLGGEGGWITTYQTPSIVLVYTHSSSNSNSSVIQVLYIDGLSVQTVVGMLYNPFSGYWHWSENTSLNYAAHAVKSGVQEHPVSAEFAFKGETEELQANACTNPAVHEELKK
uniref:Coenzyme Q3, methyltransferase n=1 Tax=Chlorocebus sabaeus TaxID=60711 RepID=A0A0D9RQ05_CHLSB